jgi:nitrous oxidase accessory protein NosD
LFKDIVVRGGVANTADIAATVGNGISFGPAAGGILEGCRSESNGYAGFYAATTGVISFVGNAFAGNRYGICLSGASQVTGEGNTFERNCYGIVVRAQGSYESSGDTAANNSKFGVWLNQCARAELRNLNALGNRSDGIRMEKDARATINGGRVERNANGVAVRGNAYAEISGLAVLENRGDGLRFQDASSVHASGNVVENNGGSGIHAMHDTHATCRDNTTTGNADADVLIEETVRRDARIETSGRTTDKRKRSWL